MSGKITLVGAGPGDSGLLTLKAKTAIESADIVFYDRLVGTGIVAMIPTATQSVDVGKNAGNHKVPQEEINALILTSALEGKNVVRLKGGDPYLFGRGAEELEGVVAAGIDFEVIPGITSAIAVPALAGIPVTHRDYSSSLHIITAHRKKDKPLEIDFESLVKMKGTLVFLMGTSELEAIAKSLIGAGMAESTPAALVMNGSTHRQRKLVSTIGNIAKRAEEEGFGSPSVVVVGEVCRLSEKLDTTGIKPLSGISVLLTRPQNKNSALAEKLKELGGEVTEIPMIRMRPEPMGAELAKSLPDYNWIVFTSGTGIETFFNSLVDNKLDVRSLNHCKFAVVGKESEKALNQRGIMADYTPKIFDAEHLAEGLAEVIKPTDRVLLYRSVLGRELLFKEILKLTSRVDDISAYSTDLANHYSRYFSDKVVENEFDYVMFTSGSTVEGFVALVGSIDFSKIKVVCIGHQTEEKAKKYGMKIYRSKETTINSMVEKLTELVEGEND